jgi:hypothetical protein
MRVVDCLRFEKRRNKGIAPYGPNSPVEKQNGYCPAKIAFGIMPWMPLVPSTTCVTW